MKLKIKPVFIIGSPRSGTTFLLKTLASNTNISAAVLRDDNLKFFNQGTQLSTNTNSDLLNPSNNFNNTSPMKIGTNFSNDESFFTGFLQELIIFNTDFDQNKLLEVSNILKHKYNI